MSTSLARRPLRAFAAVSTLALIVACSQQTSSDAEGNATEDATTTETADTGGEVTAADAEAFVDRVEAEYKVAGEEAGHVFWIQNTFITYDTNWLAAKIGAKLTKMAVDYANESKKYAGLELTPEVARKMDFIRQAITLPAPSKDGAAEELSEITTQLDADYSTGTIDLQGGNFSEEEIASLVRRLRDPDGEQSDLDVSGASIAQNETELLMRWLRDPAELAEVWTKWNDYAAKMKPSYVRMVEIANEGARELGFSDVGELWRSGYDMDADEFAEEVDRLWGQVKPLYDELHCHVRAKLNEKYGNEIVPLDQPIRADLLGNMWAQSWGPIYDLAAPPGGGTEIDLDKLLVEAGYDPIKMVETGEAFFTSLGFEPLPETFWERSQITKPVGRDVVCHASAWDIDSEDFRIKMCTNVNGEDFRTIHHELGHNFYQRAAKKQSVLFQGGAHDGFHEAIGDMVSLSITPEYLQQIGLVDQVPGAEGDLGLLMQQALDKVAFLPFGLLVDKWRWQVFSGELTPDQYNDGWWALRTQYQGIRPPTDRPADAFDPGAKYHIPGNTPYMRYFLAHILQFQFYKAACDQIGWEGPLHRCTFYGSKEVGERFNAMLEMGASQPWPDALDAFTGTREMDGSAVVEYFAPLMEWLKEQNQDRQCGW